MPNMATYGNGHGRGGGVDAATLSKYNPPCKRAICFFTVTPARDASVHGLAAFRVPATLRRYVATGCTLSLRSKTLSVGLRRHCR